MTRPQPRSWVSSRWRKNLTQHVWVVSPEFLALVLLMVQKSHSQPPFGFIKPWKNNGINYQPPLVNPGFLNHQQYENIGCLQLLWLIFITCHIYLKIKFWHWHWHWNPRKKLWALSEFPPTRSSTNPGHLVFARMVSKMRSKSSNWSWSGRFRVANIPLDGEPEIPRPTTVWMVLKP